MNYDTLETICEVLANRVKELEAQLHDEREMETSSVLDMCCRIYPLKVEDGNLLVYPGVGEYIPLENLSRSYMAMMDKQSAFHVRVADLQRDNDALNVQINNVREEKEALRQQSMKADDIIHELRRRLREAHLDASLPNADEDRIEVDDVEDHIVTDEERSYGPRKRSK